MEWKAAELPMPPATGAEPCFKVDAFFPEEYGLDDPEVRSALALCGGCDLARLCMVWSLAHPGMTEAGIWGGTTPYQRRSIRRRLIGRWGQAGAQEHLRASYREALSKFRARDRDVGFCRQGSA
ncbi:WhiB family transcriptional regulator [Streptomyces zaomyceticus]|uniref:WhiB family transcriptional regulator n=1 Tax=Streptomyces zaomyceticus TaxID=68286 RepID=UPI0036B316F6